MSFDTSGSFNFTILPLPLGADSVELFRRVKFIENDPNIKVSKSSGKQQNNNNSNNNSDGDFPLSYRIKRYTTKQPSVSTGNNNNTALFIIYENVYAVFCSTFSHTHFANDLSLCILSLMCRRCQATDIDTSFRLKFRFTSVE